MIQFWWKLWVSRFSVMLDTVMLVMLNFQGFDLILLLLMHVCFVLNRPLKDSLHLLTFFPCLRSVPSVSLLEFSLS